MPCTIKDIAAQAGVSIATVSLVLNHKPCRISADTRHKIEIIAHKLNYAPNLSARTLVKKESRTLGLILPDIGNLFFAELAKGVEREAKKSGYSIMFCNSDEQGQNDVENLKLLISHPVDAVVIVTSIRTEDSVYAEEFNALAQTSRMPIVQFDRRIKGGNYDTVSINNRMGGYLATKFLLSKGYKQIGCITGPLETSSAAARFSGYCDAMNENGPWNRAWLVAQGNYTMESGKEQADILLQHPLDAIFACNDLMAIGASRALRQRGKKIGIDFALMGFDNNPICDYLETPLTTVDQNIYSMGKEACRLALAAIEDRKEGRKRNRTNISFSPSLIIRSTTNKKTDL